MSGISKIEWVNGGATWNPVTGCSKVSPGCDNCYAEVISHRFSSIPGHKFEGTTDDDDGKWSGKIVCHPEALTEPLHWRKPRMIFTCSMSDLFHNQVPWKFLVDVFNIMSATSWHTYLILTKRPGRMAYFAQNIWPKQGGRWAPIRPIEHNQWPGTRWPDNVWAGTSVETQKYAPRLDVLAHIPAKMRFVSVEPLLSPLNLMSWLPDVNHDRCLAWDISGHQDDEGVVSWVIVGSESGNHARPMDLDWVRSLRDQCVAAGVPFFFKQAIMDGKRVSLPFLDGRQWMEFPEKCQ